MEQNSRIKKELIESILELEVKMFASVPTEEEPSCRSDIESMRLHRSSQFAGWSESTCKSYLEDLKKANKSGINLMTLKYARMGKQIPPLSSNPYLSAICDQYVKWQQEIIDQYPNTMRRSRTIEDFRNYLCSELETYSDDTLSLLWNDIQSCCEAGRNLSLETYTYLAEQAGYSSLKDLEKNLA